MSRSRNHKQNVGLHRKLDIARKPKNELPQTAQRQAAALVFRISEERGLEILLLTSRRTGRAVLPKGWLNADEQDYEAAAREAYEEAGIVGRIAREPVGSYEYWKELTTGGQFLRVDVYPLEVDRQCKQWPE
jgi:8-oxo-dGTP pyrophosphatase MutT (NUDIX family)